MELAIRLAIFLLVAILGAYLDCRRKPNDVERKYAYQTVLGCGIAGGIFGALFDQITATLCREYFTVIKELPDESPLAFRIHLLFYGFTAGVLPGLIAGACLAFADRTYEPRWKPAKFIPFLRYPLLCISILIPIVWYMVSKLPWLTVGHQFSMDIPTEWSQSLALVWSMHLSVYMGGFLGTVVATIQLVRIKKQLRPESLTNKATAVAEQQWLSDEV